MLGVVMKIVLVSQSGCPRCMLAEDKLRRLGLEYTKTTDVTVIKDIGRADQLKFPVILIDDVVHDYAGAMKKLKEATHEADA